MSELQNQSGPRSAEELLRTLRERGVQLTIHEDRLRASAPAGVIGPEETAAIREWKPDLLRLLALEGEAAERTPVRVSPAQERLWLFQELDPEATTYNLTAAVRIEGRLDRARLEAALRRVIDRHEPLRSRIVAGPDGPVIIVDAHPARLLSFVDVSGVSEADRAAAAQAAAGDMMRRPFRLDSEPPLRALLVRLRGDVHELYTTLHHIAVDGVSLQHYYRDLAAFYGGVDPEPLRATYRDYARWQREYWTAERLAARKEFWRGALAEAPRVLDLPVDSHRGAVQTFSGALTSCTLDGDALQSVTDLARSERASIFMVMLAAFSAALHRESGQRDLVIGTPLHGRERSDYADLVGMFVNQLPLRMHVPRGASLRELVRNARDTALGMMAEHEMPFGEIVDALGAPRDQSRTPLFQVMLNVIPGADVATGIPAGDVVFRLPEPHELLKLFDGQSKFDLTLYVLQRESALHLILNYNRDLFAEERMSRLVGSVSRLLQVASPDEPIDTAVAAPVRPLVAVADIDSAFVDDTVVDRVSRHAAVHPDHPAVADSERTLTYAELMREAGRVALLVSQAAGGGAARPVGVMVPHDTRAAVAILGALASGSPYVPLDPQYPEERLRYMAADAGIGVLLVTESLRDRAAAIVDDGVRLVALSDTPAPTSNRPTAPASTDLAYLLYTSGSTGRPKAVMQSHRNLMAQAGRYAATLDVHPQDRLALTASISFDASLMDLFGALLRGASVRLIDLRNTDIADVPAIARDAGVTTLHVTPTVFRAIARTAGPGSWPTIRAVVLGGEPVRVEDVRYFDSAFGGSCTLLNLYGASEHSFSFGHFVDRHQHSVEIPIGRPLGDVDAVLLDESGNEEEVVGELAIRSAHSALGYWRTDDKTVRTFVPDPRYAGRVLYRTGDLARRRPDGLLVVLGRVDSQMKVRGHRIEPHEIETVLRDHPDIVDAGVHAPANEAGERTLTACYTSRSGSTLTEAQLFEWCSSRLPRYMVPTAWVATDALPRTPSGKVDRRSLPAAATAVRVATAAVEEGRGAEEQVLRQIWSEVLGRETIGLHDDFFAQGGHSLTATQVIARVRDLLDVEVPLRAFFDNSTIAQTAAWIREHRAGHVALPPLTRAESYPDPMPLSYSQERMWLLKQLAPESAAYNMAAASRIVGALDIERLRAAVQEVARRQEALRTRFATRGGRPTQTVVDPAVEFTFEEVVGVPVEELCATRVLDVLMADYDLATGPLCRVYVARLGPDEHVLGVGMHHIISDMWAFSVFAREVASIYNGHAPADPIVQYRDYTLWQRKWLENGVLEQQLAHWKGRLSGLQPLELPIDRPRPPFFEFNGEILERPLDADLRAAIETMSASMRATPFMTLLAAFNALLSSYTSQTDIAVGVPIANRTQTATEDLIASFVNTLVHRNDLSGDPTFREILARVRSNALDAFAHQDTPFEVLVKELQPTRDPSRPPLTQVLFNVANVRMDGPRLTGVEQSLLDLPRRTAQFELTLNVGLNALQSQLSFTYNTSLFRRETAEQMLDQYVRILERAVQNPDLRLSELSRVPEQQVARVSEWNATARDLPVTDVPALLVAAAQRTPDRVAVVSPSGPFTYAELVEYSQRVTGALRAVGVGPGDRVAIVMQRSREMLGALLGILGVGAAYVPVDPNYPAARVQYMLDDSGVAALITHRGLERPYSPTVPVIDLDRWTQPPAAPFAAPEQSRAAYVIYTSGSTGKPKGVEIPHGAMINFLLSMQERPGLKPEDTLLAVTTISFDISVLELFLPLITGARLVIASEDEALDGRRLLQLMEREQVTLMQATPATWKLLIAAGWAGKHDLRVLCGGEPLPRALADDLLDRVAELWNMYGPTETTVWSTLDQVMRDEPILVGRPIANTSVYVLDDRLELRPIGVPGELYIGGAGVATGYVNRPDLTAERFISSPFREGERLYRTGDLVRLRHDGRLEHLGRLDGQVKVRGFRIELGEVESALHSHDAVRDAAVVAADDRLIAYVVFERGMHATVTDLRSWAGKTLPPYMVPSFIVPLEELPLTPNGKVDRKRLPDPGTHAQAPAIPDVPMDPTARMIAEIWSSLLGLDTVSIEDNFFEIGGHSLLAMQVVAEIEERTGHRPEPRSLFFMSLGEFAASIPAPAVTT